MVAQDQRRAVIQRGSGFAPGATIRCDNSAAGSEMESMIGRQSLGDLLRRTARRTPEKVAVACGDVNWTFAQFDALCTRLAAGLAGIGVTKGERIAILARNSHAFCAMRFALARLGAVLVPVNFMLNAEEVGYILRHSGARVLAVDSGLAKLAQC